MSHKIPLLVISIFLLTVPFSRAQAPPLTQRIDPPAGLEFCDEPVPFELPDVLERFEKEMLLTLWDRPQVILWLKREPRYLTIIAEELKSNHMPEDLKYLAVAESALRPHVGSVKGAIGFWQLLPETARNYGLTVDEFVDQRRDIYASTAAAIAYLRKLYDKFGSWTLAVAAYNMGEDGMAAEILEQNTKNYYKLYLPLETQRFIFRILAAKLIISDPDKYGFAIKDKDTYQPLSFDMVAIDLFKETPLRLVAQAAGTDFKRIKDLNPHLRGHYLQEGHHPIRIPLGSARAFQKNFDKFIADHSRELQQRIYVVQSGDSLSSIADKFEVPLAAILIWNRVDLNRSIHPGDRLLIYPRQLKDIKP